MAFRSMSCFLAVLGLLIHQAQGGSFMSGSIRWQKIGPTAVRFDIATYWTRSYSVYNNPTVGQLGIIIAAQDSVTFDPGDGSTPMFLKGNVTAVSLEEDWFAATTTVFYNYPQPYLSTVRVTDFSNSSQSYKDINTPWTASLSGCCRFTSTSSSWSKRLTNDGGGRFQLTALVDLTRAASADPRNPPRIFLQDVPVNFSISTPIPYMRPTSLPSPSVMFRWCRSTTQTAQTGWSLPQIPATLTHSAVTTIAIDPSTGVMTWRGGVVAALGGAAGAGAASTLGFHLCVETCIGSCDWTDAPAGRIASQTDFMLLVSASSDSVAAAPTISPPVAGLAGAVIGRPFSLAFSAAASAAAAAAAAALTSGSFPGLRVTTGYSGPVDYGMTDSLGRFVSISPVQGSGTSLSPVLSYRPPAGVQGWSSVCMQASLGGGESTTYISSPVVCQDFLFVDTDVPTVTITADSYQVGASTFLLRDGQTLVGNVVASLIAQDDVVSAKIQPAVTGATLTPVTTGSNVALYTLTYTPGRTDSGGAIAICIVAQGKTASDGTFSQGKTCLQVNVQRCVWSVREEESLITLAQDLKIGWLQLWNFNKAWLSRPDDGLSPGQAVQVGQLYTAVPGDSVTTLAATFATTKDTLYQLNADLAAGTVLQPGMQVCVAFSQCASA